jgi:hypothetical protein
VIFKPICEISGFSNNETEALFLLDVTWHSLVAGSWQLVAICQPTLRNIRQDGNVKLTSIPKNKVKNIFYQPKPAGICILSALHATNWLTSLFVQRPGFDKIE